MKRPPNATSRVVLENINKGRFLKGTGKAIVYQDSYLVFVECKRNYWTIDGKRVWYLAEAYTPPRLRKRGSMSRILEFALKAMHDHADDTAFVVASIERGASHRGSPILKSAFERRGVKFTVLTSNYYNDEDTLVTLAS